MRAYCSHHHNASYPSIFVISWIALCDKHPYYFVIFHVNGQTGKLTLAVAFPSTALRYPEKSERLIHYEEA